MSVRAVESHFNLRSVVAEETASRPLVLRQTPESTTPVSAPPMPVSKGGGLRFDFSAIKHTAHGVSPVHKAQLSVDLRPTQFASAPLKNPFERSKDTSKEDVMRLTAMVDDLNARLKKTVERANMAETQLQKTHSALVSERTTASERIKAINAQLGTAHALETQLRGEITKVAKSAPAVQAPKAQNFETAVSAVMAADGALEKSKREVDQLKRQLKDKEDDSDRISANVSKMRSENAKVTEESIELQKQYSVAVRELADARSAERSAIQELAEVRLLLVEAKKKAESAEQSIYTIQSEQVLVSCCPKCSMPVGCCTDDADPPQVEVVGDEHAAPAEPTAPSTPPLNETLPDTESVVSKAPATNLDPIKMHARYNRIKEKVLELTGTIAKMQAAERDGDELSKLIEIRDDLYARARDLKLKYDTVFGTADPDSVVKLSGTETFVSKETNDDELEQLSYEPMGEPPDPPFSYTISFAREMATNCPLGGAFDFGSYDSGVGIGSTHVAPITVGGCIIEAEVDAEQEPTEGRDAQTNMVQAVIADLTNFLKHEKSKDDKSNDFLYERSSAAVAL